MVIVKTEERTVTDLTIRLEFEDAVALYTLVSHAEELPVDHPLHDAASRIYLALSDPMIQNRESYELRQRLYRSIRISDNR